MSLACSTARIDITPQPGAPMGGYGCDTAPRLATGTYSPLSARCVVLWDSGYPNVVVSADLLGIPAALNAQVRAGVADRVPDTDLMLLASHTHNGPALTGGLDPWITYALADTTAVDAYTTWLGDALIGLIRAALDAPQTKVTLDYQVASQSWSRNRAGLSYTETAVPVLTARDATGQPVVVLYSYGCHPVAAGTQTRWDGDYPAAASAVIEAAIPGALAVFTPGPAGDQNPAGSMSWRLRDKLGAQLGSAVVTSVAVTGRAIGGPIYTGYTMVDLPLDVTTTAANLVALRAAYATRAASGPYAWYRRHGQWMVDQIDAGTPLPTSVPVPVQVWRLSGSPMLRWAVVGGELVSGYAAYFRPKYNGTNGLMIGGYGNGCACYLPSNELLPPIRTTSSYEGGWDTDAPGIAGGSMTVYARDAHFKAGAGGIEDTLIAAISQQLG